MRKTEAGGVLQAIPDLTPIVGPWSFRVRLADGQRAEATPLGRALGRAGSRRMSAALAGALVVVLALIQPLAAGVAAVAAGGALLALTLVKRRRRSERDRAADGDRRYRTLLDHLPLVTVVNRASDLEQLYVSAQVERLLGVPHEQALRAGDVWSDRLHPLDRERVLAAWTSWLSGARLAPFRSDYRMLRDDDRVVWVEDVTIVVPGRDDVPSSFQRHLIDVTRQRQLEEQLRQAQRLELLGRLAAGVAHDFNNLLAVIAGYAERLGSDLPPQAYEESIVAIGTAATRGASLVQQLLAFSRPQPTHTRVIDLNGQLRDFEPLLRRIIGEDLELDLQLDRRRLPVEVHPVQIDQVLMNVVVNARDAMPSGGRLTITTATAGTGGAVLEELGLEHAAVLTVTDTGWGIDETTQEHIFEPFFSTKGPAKGSGLGLSTTYGIVRNAGGTITVSSARGRGTTFSIYLPLADAELVPAETQTVDTAPATGGRETVLVVEDEPALRELERVMLEEAGYEVVTAENASEALVLAARHAIDVLVVDVVMPGMSGPQLAVELAARGWRGPAVFVSGYGAEEIAGRGVVSGNDAVVEKPFEADVLRRRVREVLDRTAAARLGEHAVVRLVRCLACDALYGRPERQVARAGAGCPRCGYAGWTGAASKEA